MIPQKPHVLIVLFMSILFTSAGYPAAQFIERDLKMNPATATLMIELLESGQALDKVRAAMALASARISTPEAITALLKNTTAESREVRAAVIHALTRSRDSAGLTEAAKAASDPEWQVQMYALLGLQEYPAAAPSTEAALNALSSADSTVRLAALQSLAVIALPSPEALQKLLDFLQKEEEPRLEAATLHVLAERFPQTTSEEVLPFLHHPAPQVASTAFAVVQSHRLDGLTTETTAALSHAHPVVRRAALRALARCNPEIASEALSPMVQDEDVSVRETLAQTLGEAALPAGIPSLNRLQEDDFRSVRRLASSALLAIAKSHPDTLPTLLHTAVAGTGSQRPRIRVESLYLIGKIKDKSAIPAVMKNLTPYLSQLPEQRMLIWAISHCEATTFSKRVLDAALSGDLALRLHGAIGIGLLRYTEAVPTVRKTLNEIKVMEGIPFYVYAGQARTELIHSLQKIGTPEAVEVAVERVSATRVLEDEESFQAALNILVEHKVVQARANLEATYRFKDTSDGHKRKIVTALRMILNQDDVGLDMPILPPSYDTFFLNAR